VDAIHSETEGNPLFVGEIVRLLTAEGGFGAAEVEKLGVPEGVREVIGRRLRHLSPRCNEILILASVLGREFDVNALARISDTERDAVLDVLDEAMTARVVSELPGSAGRIRFEHALIRDTAYESVTRARRAQLHRRVGEALEDLYAADPEPHLVELAHHFFEALPGGNVEKAMRYAVAAAERAIDQLAYEEAARLYEMALTLVTEDAARCELLLALGNAYARAGDTPASKRAFLEAAELADARQLPDLLGRAAFGYGGRILWDVSRDDEQLIALVERALAAIGDEETPLRVRLLARLAGGPLRDSSFPPELKRARGEEAVAMARRIGDPETLAYALAGYSQAHLSPDRYKELVPVTEEWVAVALAVGDKERALEAHEQLFLHLLGLGEVAGARVSLNEMVRFAQELRQPPQLWLVAVDEALLALLEGRFGEAERLIEQAAELGSAAPRWNAETTYRLQLYLLRRAQGRLDELVETLEATPEELDFRTYPIVDCVLARLYDELERQDDARAIFERIAADGFARIPFDEEWLVSVGLLAELAHSLEDRSSANALYEQLSPYADQIAVAYPEISTGSVSRYLGLLAATLTRWDEAERHFADALAANERIGARPWLAQTQEDYARILRGLDRPGDREAARDLFNRALATYRELGMESYAARIAALS
jgi:tetratricopeptide (TPR) repeat protein